VTVTRAAVYDPPVRIRYAILPAFLLLAACEPMADIPMERETASSAASSIADLETDTGSGDVDVTAEPFVDPLAPLALTGAALDVEERTLSGGTLEIGSARAKTEMTVFLHPQSPYSQEFQRSRMPRLVSDMVARGTLRVKLYVLPIQKYAGSAFAARAVACAGAQGHGYPTFDRLTREGRTDLAAEDLADIGLDETIYRSCIQTGTDDPLAASARAADLLDVTLVPSYVIDGTVHVGLPSEADLLGVVRAAQ
jgi:protein-disulfide isomerase